MLFVLLSLNLTSVYSSTPFLSFSFYLLFHLTLLQFIFSFTFMHPSLIPIARVFRKPVKRIRPRIISYCRLLFVRTYLWIKTSKKLSTTEAGTTCFFFLSYVSSLLEDTKFTFTLGQCMHKQRNLEEKTSKGKLGQYTKLDKWVGDRSMDKDVSFLNLQYFFPILFDNILTFSENGHYNNVVDKNVIFLINVATMILVTFIVWNLWLYNCLHLSS